MPSRRQSVPGCTADCVLAVPVQRVPRVKRSRIAHGSGFRFRLYRVPAVVSPVEMIAWKAGPLSLAAPASTGFPRSGGFPAQGVLEGCKPVRPVQSSAALLPESRRPSGHIARLTVHTIESLTSQLPAALSGCGSERAIQPFFQNSDATEAAFVQVVPVLSRFWGLE